MDMERHQSILSDCHERHEAELSVMRLQLALAREALKHWMDSSLCEPSLSLCIRHSDQALAVVDGSKLLDGLVLCDAEPVAWVDHHKGGDNLVWDEPGGNKTPLYSRRKP